MQHILTFLNLFDFIHPKINTLTQLASPLAFSQLIHYLYDRPFKPLSYDQVKSMLLEYIQEIILIDYQIDIESIQQQDEVEIEKMVNLFCVAIFQGHKKYEAVELLQQLSDEEQLLIVEYIEPFQQQQQIHNKYVTNLEEYEMENSTLKKQLQSLQWQFDNYKSEVGMQIQQLTQQLLEYKNIEAEKQNMVENYVSKEAVLIQLELKDLEIRKLLLENNAHESQIESQFQQLNQLQDQIEQMTGQLSKMHDLQAKNDELKYQIQQLQSLQARPSQPISMQSPPQQNNQKLDKYKRLYQEQKAIKSRLEFELKQCKANSKRTSRQASLKKNDLDEFIQKLSFQENFPQLGNQQATWQFPTEEHQKCQELNERIKLLEATIKKLERKIEKLTKNQYLDEKNKKILKLQERIRTIEKQKDQIAACINSDSDIIQNLANKLVEQEDMILNMRQKLSVYEEQNIEKSLKIQAKRYQEELEMKESQLHLVISALLELKGNVLQI